jgi:hypothetical protein
MTNTNNKTEKQLEKLSTKRLLSYYKAERKRLYKFKGSHTCECCGMTDWEMKTNDYTKMLSKQYYDKLIYLDMIKSVLDKREHVKVK